MWILHLLAAFEESVELTGVTRKQVNCEHCSTVFEYDMTRNVLMRGLRSEEALETVGRTKLSRILEAECDPHPCPGCGYYQQDMVRKLRRNAFGRVPKGIYWALFGMIASPFLIMPHFIDELMPRGVSFYLLLTIFAISSISVMLFLGRRIAWLFTNPNRGYTPPEVTDSP